MKADITVLIITYNRAGTFLSDAIDGVLSQTHKNIKVVIYDNGSTDNTEELVRSYMEKDDRIIYHREDVNSHSLPKAEAQAALLSVVKRYADTKYIIETHDDDIMKPHMLQTEFEYLESNQDVVMVACDADYVDDEKHPLIGLVSEHKGTQLVYKQMEYIQEVIRLNANIPIFILPTWLVTADAYIKMISETTSVMGDDGHRIRQLILNSMGKIACIDKKMMIRRFHDTQDSVESKMGIQRAARMEMVPYLKQFCTEEQYEFLQKIYGVKNSSEAREKEIDDKIKAANSRIKLLDCTQVVNNYNNSGVELGITFGIKEIFGRLQYIYNSGIMEREYLIWGAGSAGRITKQLFEAALPEFRCAGFLDAYKIGELEGVPIIKVSDYVFESMDKYIVIATSMGMIEAFDTLEKSGRKYMDDFIIGYC